MRSQRTAAIAAARLLGMSSFAMAAENSATGNTTGTTAAPSPATGMEERSLSIASTPPR